MIRIGFDGRVFDNFWWNEMDNVQKVNVSKLSPDWEAIRKCSWDLLPIHQSWAMFVKVFLLVFYLIVIVECLAVVLCFDFIFDCGRIIFMPRFQVNICWSLFSASFYVRRVCTRVRVCQCLCISSLSFLIRQYIITKIKSTQKNEERYFHFVFFSTPGCRSAHIFSHSLSLAQVVAMRCR